MSNFFDEKQFNNITTTKDNEIESVNNFSRQNPNITLGDLKSQDDINREKINSINMQDIKEFKTNESGFSARNFKKQDEKKNALVRARVKIFVTTFILVTLVMTGFVVYNLISTIMLSNQIKNNEVKIKAKQESNAATIQVCKNLPVSKVLRDYKINV